MKKKKLQFQLPLLLFSLLTNKTVLTNIKSLELHDIAVIVTLYPSKIITSCHVTVEICFLLTNLNWLIYILPAGWLWSKSRTGWICVNVGFHTYGIGRFLEFCYQYIGNITADMFSISTIISGFWEYWWGNSSNCKIHAFYNDCSCPFVDTGGITPWIKCNLKEPTYMSIKSIR